MDQLVSFLFTYSYEYKKLKYWSMMGLKKYFSPLPLLDYHLIYTSCSYRCGFYSELIVVESKVIKQTHSLRYTTGLLTPLSAKIAPQKTTVVAV
jgi:hypothetical protein